MEKNLEKKQSALMNDSELSEYKISASNDDWEKALKVK